MKKNLSCDRERRRATTNRPIEKFNFNQTKYLVCNHRTLDDVHATSTTIRKKVYTIGPSWSPYKLFINYLFCLFIKKTIILLWCILKICFFPFIVPGIIIMTTRHYTRGQVPERNASVKPMCSVPKAFFLFFKFTEHAFTCSKKFFSPTSAINKHSYLLILSRIFYVFSLWYARANLLARRLARRN